MVHVIKLGGSFHASPRLDEWLAALAQAGGRVVLVPGGGPFADQVRQAQQDLGFSDAVAHRMALLAMAQFGLLLCDRAPGLEPAASRQDMAAILARGRTPVWLPETLCLGHPDIPESWDVTSDSLALWLAGELDARGLGLVKQAPPDWAEDMALLVRSGQVDPAFTDFMVRHPVPLRLFGAGQANLLAAWLE